MPDTPEGRAEAARRIMPAVVGATLTTAVVLFPFLYLQGDTRAAFVPFAAAFALALAWSVVTALLVVPALGRGGAVQPVTWPRMARGLPRGAARHAALALGHACPSASALLAVMTWGFMKKVPRSSWGGWGDRRTTLGVNLTFPRGSDPETLDRAMREFESLVVGRPEVEQVATQGSMTSANMQVLFTRDGGLTAVPLELEELLTQRAVLVGGANISVRGEGPGFYAGGGGGIQRGVPHPGARLLVRRRDRAGRGPQGRASSASPRVRDVTHHLGARLGERARLRRDARARSRMRCSATA